MERKSLLRYRNTLNPQLKNKLIYDSISEKDVEKLANPTYENLSKFAIDFSDGVILGSPKVNDEVAKYAKSSGKPMLDYQAPESYMDAFNDFYDNL